MCRFYIHMWSQRHFSLRHSGALGTGGDSEVWWPLCPGCPLTARASLQIVSHDTRRFRFALPSPQHILGLPVGECDPDPAQMELGASSERRGLCASTRESREGFKEEVAATLGL